MKQIALQSLAARLGLSLTSDAVVLGYRIDSRLVEPGDLFFALPGARTDGHSHMQEAKEKGAIAACVNRAYKGSDFGLDLLVVEDVLQALHTLAKVSLDLHRPFIIAVTGSVGKTTTKDFIAALLSKAYRVAKTPRSYNSQQTFPLCLLNRRNEEVLVLEMGVSQPGEMQTLVQIAAPDLALITKISLAHAEFFPGGLEEIAQEKKQIFSRPQTKTVILPSGLEKQDFLGKVVRFSREDEKADYFLDTTGWVYEKGEKVHLLSLPFQEEHLLYDLLAAVAVARQMNISWEEIDRQVSSLKLPQMRFEKFEREGIYFINDTYNASPESMRAVLSSLPKPKGGGKRLAVLGDMRELGKFSQDAHREIGRFAQKYLDYLLTFGSESKVLSETFGESQKPTEHMTNKEDLVLKLKELMKPGDVVLVKGSRSLALETVFSSLFAEGGV